MSHPSLIDLSSLAHKPLAIMTRSSSRKVRIRVPFFCFVYFSWGTLRKKRNRKRALLGDLDEVPSLQTTDSPSPLNIAAVL